jgi:fumarate hydratase, class II
MLVTALSLAIGYEQAAGIAHRALERDTTLKAAALELGFVTEEDFDRWRRW